MITDTSTAHDLRRVVREAVNLSGITISSSSLTLLTQLLAPALRKMVHQFLTQERETANQEREQLTPGMRLTPGERQVMYHMCQGLSVRESAARMNCPLETVRSRRRAIFAKWRVNSTIQVALTALRLGVVQLRDLEDMERRRSHGNIDTTG